MLPVRDSTRYFLAPLTVNKEGSKSLMVIRAYTNSAPDQQSLYPDAHNTRAFYIKNVPPVGQLVLLFSAQLLKKSS